MSRRSQNRNQYESTTTGELAAGAFSVTVDSTAGLITDQNMYLVIEPDVPGQREWLLIESITGNQFNIANPNGRNLTGSDGDLTHPAGSKMRSVPSQQIFEDIFADAEDDELALTQHQTDGGDPHAQAGYVTQGQTDPLYVNVTGDSMNPGAQIKVDTTPLSLDDLARKGYVDDSINAIGPHFSGDHNDLTNVQVDDHHVRYADTEAVDAMGTVDDSNDLNHVKYDDADVEGVITHRVITVESILSAGKVADSTVIATFVLPSETGECLIQISGPCGFDTADRQVSFEITGTGVHDSLSERILAVNNQLAVAAGWAQAPLDGQTISIQADADGPCFYRGVLTITKL